MMKPICYSAILIFLVFTACQEKPTTEVVEEKLEIPECVVTSPPDSLHLDKFYSKYVDVNGLPLISSWRVPDSAFTAAHRTLYAMTSMLAPEVLQAMKNADARIAIMGRYEGTTDIPEHRYLVNDTALNWDLRARGWAALWKNRSPVALKRMCWPIRLTNTMQRIYWCMSLLMPSIASASSRWTPHSTTACRPYTRKRKIVGFSIIHTEPQTRRSILLRLCRIGSMSTQKCLTLTANTTGATLARNWKSTTPLFINFFRNISRKPTSTSANIKK